MSKYDGLNPRTELEQTITADLKKAFEKRGFEVKHNGTKDSQATGGLSDIEVWNGQVHFNIEVTKSIKSSADREFLAIIDHLSETKYDNIGKKCFIIYISPETHYRMINAIRDFNTNKKDEKDQKIIPVCFSTFELFVNKLIQSHKDLYTKSQILSLFDEYKNFVDDERVLKIFYTKLFSDDEKLGKEVAIREEEKHQSTIESLIRDLLRLEDNLREELGITHIDAIRNIIFLVFTKLYEEKREFEGKENRFRPESFKRFQEYVGEEKTKKAIEKLFNEIKKDKELESAKVFTQYDVLAEKLDDDFVMNFLIKPFEKYIFYTTKIDGLGAAYEVLGMRTGKDVKAGQFFTPENVVRFMVKLAELDANDLVLDPACGTGRFLIYSMEDMISKVKGRNIDDKIEEIKKKQLFGADYDVNVAKLSKMNMYIHGDGKTNIRDSDGLLIYDFDNKVDVILTNPPLGDQSYQKTSYDADFKLKRMDVIPKKDATQEKINEYNKRLEDTKNKLKEAKDTQNFKLAKKTYATIKFCERKLTELSTQKHEYEVTGKQMKGGALFIGASKHYLKNVRDSSSPLEWRGGKLLIILDEGILNTEEYREIRELIKKYFYIKAIISLSRDTFVPVSDTTTKTSILYAIKKEDSDAAQQEPIFFAHAEKVGIDTRSKICANHLFNSGNDVLSKYFEFKNKVLASYYGLNFSKEKFMKQSFKGGVIDA